MYSQYWISEAFFNVDIARPNLGLKILTPAPEIEVQVPRLSDRVAAKARPKLERERKIRNSSEQT